MVCGPCKSNIDIVWKDSPTFHFYTLIKRLLDQIDHPFYELKNLLVLFLLAMCEGRDENIILNIKNCLPAPIIDDQIIRIMKKIHIREVLYETFTNKSTKKYIEKQKADHYEKNNENKENKINAPKLMSKYFFKIAQDLNDKKDNSQSIELQETPKNFSFRQIFKTTDLNSSTNQSDDKKDGKRYKLEQMKDLEKEVNKIYQKMELDAMFTIHDWRDLFYYYKNSERFSDGVLLQTILNLMKLWNILCLYSRSHKMRLVDIKNNADRYYSKEADETEQINTKKEKRRPGNLATYYFLKNITRTLEIVSNGEHL